MTTIQQLTIQDLDLIDNFFQEELKSVPKEMFSSLGRVLIEKSLNTPFSYGIWLDNQLIAVSIAYIPGMGLNNYGHDLDYSEAQLEKVVQVIGIIVNPNYYQKGLGYTLLCQNCAAIFKTTFDIVLMTIHPDNIGSIKTAEKTGFVAKKQVLKYGNCPRVIFENLKRNDIFNDE
jgi:RimJ/RimL family protein N-acetyltransferase